MIAYLTIVLLLSGFLFTSKYPQARFKQIRAKYWTLYCHLFYWGVIWGGIAFIELYLGRRALVHFDCFTFLINEIYSYLSQIYLEIMAIAPNYNVSENLLTWSLLSIISSYLFGLFSTIPFLPFKNMAFKKITRENDLLCKLAESSKSGDFVQVSLKNRKVYVGLVWQNKNDVKNEPIEYVVLLPICSGYRNCRDMTIKFLNDYSVVYFNINKKYKSALWYRWYSIMKIRNKWNFFKRISIVIIFKKKFAEKLYNKELQRFSIVIPITEIVHVGSFDYESYKIINCDQ